MSQLYAIGLNTFREAIRNKIFFSLILFALFMLGVTAVMSTASLHEEARLMKDVGLFMTSTFSVMIAIFVGVNLLYLEIQRKTIFTVVPKPIYRFQFLIGKYLGLATVMAVLVLLMGVLLALLFVVVGASFDAAMAKAVALIYVEVLVVVAIAMVFSSFSTPFLSGLLTFGVFVVGRFADRLAQDNVLAPAKEMTDQLRQLETIIQTVAAVVPDLSRYNTTKYVVYDAAIPNVYVWHAAVYGFTYAAICLLLASFLFSRRDFT